MNQKKRNMILLLFVMIVFYAIPLLAQYQQSTLSGFSWLIQNKLGNEYWGRTIPADAEIDELTGDDVSPVAFRDSSQAAIALAIYDPNSLDYKDVLTWLQNKNVKTTEDISRKIAVLAVAGKDVSVDLGTFLAYQNKSGGFGGYKSTPSDPYDTALALQALKAANFSDTTVINQALSYLTSNQNTDGGWGFIHSTGSGQAENPSNVYMTAIVSSTLQQFPQTTTIVAAITKATQYIVAHQNLDGGFGTPSNIYETSLAYLALSNVTTDGTVLGNAINYLTVNQLSNGSWNDDPYSTALALQALHLSENRPTTPPPAVFTGTISGTVVDGSTNQPLNGVAVQWSGVGVQGSGTAATANGGTFSVINVPAGSYQISYSFNGYSSYSGSVSVAAGSIINLGAILLSAIPSSGIIQGTITDTATGGPLPGVLITITGASTWTATTASDGSFKLTDIAPGSVTLSANKTGYYAVTGTGVVPAGGSLIFSPSLSTAPPAATTGGIKGIITNATTGLPVQGAAITITPATAGTAITSDASGNFAVSNIDPGTYTVSISAQNYTGQVYTATVMAGSTTDFGRIALAPKPLSTTVSGTVKNSISGQPIAAADVFVVGTATTVKTDLFGAFTIANITQSDFVLQASAEGYDSLLYNLALNSYGTYTVNFNLSPSQANDLKIISLATDTQHYGAYSPVSITVEVMNSGISAISGLVSISISNEQGELVDYQQAYSTDASGVPQFYLIFQPGNTTTLSFSWFTKEIPPGAYTIVAKASVEEASTNNVIMSAQGSTMVILEPTAAISSMELNLVPKFANIGATEQMTMHLAASNLSNIAVDLLVGYEWRSPRGLLVRSGTGRITLLPEETSKTIVLDTFPYTFAESGNYTTTMNILNGPVPARLTGNVVSVVPNIRIESSQSMTPSSVVPDGDKRIHREIRLNAVEVKP